KDFVTSFAFAVYFIEEDGLLGIGGVEDIRVNGREV
ncbi:unnamed protein product, partial [Rotaria magnacalcarata]